MPGAGTPAEELFRAGVSSPVPLPGGSIPCCPFSSSRAGLEGWEGVGNDQSKTGRQGLLLRKSLNSCEG